MTMSRSYVALIGLLLWSCPALADSPGSINPEVTQENLGQTICQTGWAKTVRPPTSFTGPIKYRLMPALADPLAFELDHVLPIEVGGCPKCVNNLQLQR